MHRPAIIILACLVFGCDDSKDQLARSKYAEMAKRAKAIGLEVRDWPGETLTVAQYSQMTQVLFLSIASTLEHQWREKHCDAEHTDCCLRIGRRLLRMADDGTLPPADADGSQKALDVMLETIRDLAPSPDAWKSYKQERLGT